MSETSVTGKEARRINRIGLAVPVRVECKVNYAVTWNEITRLSDVSAFGAGFNLTRPVKRGRLVQMTIPLPRQLRNYDFIEPQYRIWGLVRHCVPFRKSPVAPETYAIGTAFIGKFPPRSYLDDPSKIYDGAQREGEAFWRVYEADPNPDENGLPKEHRRHSRYQIPINVMLELLDDDGQVAAGEISVTENISLSGASVFTTIDAQIGSFVRVTSDQYNVSIVAVVRGRREGSDSFPRLHLEFIDRYFPLEGIEDSV
ncbi:MAG: PilZ domain-containing protein [Pyrinomonadaceae bacterium]